MHILLLTLSFHLGYLIVKGGMLVMKIRRLITSNGNEIEVTQDMLEDFLVLSDIYSVSLKDLIRHIFDCEFVTDAAIYTLKRKAG
jgi:hypothetical protein